MKSRDPFEIERLSAPASEVPTYDRSNTAADTIVGVACGATKIDQAFFEFLRKVLEPLDTDPADLGSGGHYVMKPVGENMLRRFIPCKHSFGADAETRVDITLPREAQVLPSQWAQSKVSRGILRLTK